MCCVCVIIETGACGCTLVQPLLVGACGTLKQVEICLYFVFDYHFFFVKVSI